jgi:hypothetical protein
VYQNFKNFHSLTKSPIKELWQDSKKEVKAVENLFDCSQGTLHDITDFDIKKLHINFSH